MKLQELQALLDTHKTEDGYNLEEINKGINIHIDGIVEKKKPNIDELKKELMPQATNDFIAGLGVKDVDNVDKFNAYIKTLGSSATELTESNQRITSEFNTFKTKYEELNTTHNDVMGKYNGLVESSAISKAGFKGKYTNAALAEVKSRMNDSVNFEGAISVVKKDMSEWLETASAGGATPPPSLNSTKPESKTKSWRNYNK